MNKNIFSVGSYFLVVAAVALLSACRPVTKSVSPAATSVVASGNLSGGGVQVSVSSGVEVVTPGAPFPTQSFTAADEKAFEALLDLPSATDINSALVQSGVQVLDVSSLGLPSGLTLYPGATGTLAVKDTGTGVSGVTQFTTDAPQQVIAYYEKTLNPLGYSESMKKGPDAAGKYSYGWLGNGQLVTVTITPDSGRNKIMLNWMKM